MVAREKRSTIGERPFTVISGIKLVILVILLFLSLLSSARRIYARHLNILVASNLEVMGTPMGLFAINAYAMIGSTINLVFEKFLKFVKLFTLYDWVTGMQLSVTSSTIITIA